MKRILFFLIFTFSLIAQTKDADLILNNVKDKFSKIKDYQVDVAISVDVNFLKVPEAKAKIYFKQPDLVKLESEGFALLPKEGVNFSPINLLNNSYTAIFVKEEKLDNHTVDIIKVIPDNDSNGVVLTTLWVDSEGHYIRKVESTTKNNGTLKMDLFYSEMNKWGLPNKVVFSFNVTDVALPATITGEIGGEETQKGDKKKESMSGKVTLSYSNYKVNSGIKDSFFNDDKDKETSKK